jgi:hypothetical protein
MPADASGVTTDDQGPHRNGGGDPSSAQAASGQSESSSTAPTGAPAVGNGEHAGADGNAGSPAEPGADAAGSPASGSYGSGATDAAASSSPSSSSPSSGPASWPDPTAAPLAEPDPTADPTSFGADPPATDPRPELAPAALAGTQPPPAPVLTGGTGLRGRQGRARHATPRADRASKRGLRVTQRLWSIDPWSVFKVSALFYFCLGLIILVAGTLLYNAGRSVGTIDQVESFVTRMGAYGECTAKTEVGEGVEFEEDEDKCEEGEVLVGGFTLDDGTLFRAAAIGGTVLVVAGSIGNVLLTVLLNLLNELTGGLRHTVIKEPVARPPGSGSARSPGGRRRVPTGSPGRRPQG